MTYSSVPRAVAIIMDGNGRWARARHLPRKAGHRAGALRLHDIALHGSDLGIKYLTVYAFSTENWQRPDDEISSLMNLFVEFLEKYHDELKERDVRVRFMGDIEALPADVQAAWRREEAASRDRSGLHFIVCFNYGGREELTLAARRLAREVEAGRLKADAITQADVARALLLPDVPDPDLIIRTSGEQRFSNFLLWQAAYSELYVTDTLWPDFRNEHFDAAIEAYNQRQRRFGGLGSADTAGTTPEKEA